MSSLLSFSLFQFPVLDKKNQLNSCFNRHNSLKRYFAQNLALKEMYQTDPAFKNHRRKRFNEASGLHNKFDFMT